MKIKVIIDNKTRSSLLSEWGLCVYIEYDGKSFLLDTGHSKKFLRNASDMGIEIDKVDFGILSHAHYDHSDGLKAFFKVNKAAKFYLQESAGENCYHTHRFFHEYIGIKKGMLRKFSERIARASGDFKICDGVWLIPHKTDGLEEKGKIARLSVKRDGKFYPDDFRHEQSLVFETEKGLVVFNSCSHGGADNIVKEICDTFPGKKIYAIFGGFHLFCLPDEAVIAFAQRLEKLDVQKIWTGHCTGDHAFDILKENLGDRAEQIYSGMEIEI